MAYRLRRSESVGKGLRRVAQTELRAAIEQLTRPSSDEAIHNARKSIKKIRAILQLVGEDIDAGSAGRRLRRASHLLAPLRDAEAVIGSARALCAGQRGTLSAQTCVALSHWLRQHKARVKGAARGDRVTGQAVHALRRVHRATPTWDWTDVGLSIVAAAIRRSYKKAKRGMRQARAQNRSDAFHDWRKRVKTLWYALRLLERRIPALDQPLADLKRLEGWLGDDHNLLVLRTRVGAHARHDRKDAPGARVSRLAARRQRALRRRALTLGTRVFHDRPKVFARRLREMWQQQQAAHQPRLQRHPPHGGATEPRPKGAGRRAAYRSPI